MRLRVPAQSMPVALALSRALQLTPRQVQQLLRASPVLPCDFTPDAASALAQTLQPLGVAAELVKVPPSHGRCDAHPSLTTDVQCARCRKAVCPLCQPLCVSCAAREARARRWRRLRVAVLLMVLAGVVGFALWKRRERDERHAWARPLRVAVVLASPQPVGPQELAAWSDGVRHLQAWFSSEGARYGLHLKTPVLLTLAPTVVDAQAPAAPDSTGEWLVDSEAAIKFRAELEAIARRGDAGASDARVLVALRAEGAHRVEGVGEAEGTIGMVEGTLGDTELTLELTAVAHEVLHLVGARDGYDEDGHALPRGIVEPARGFPQRFAEVMVGELPLGPAEGRIPKSLEEVRIGEVTAKEIGWK